MILRFSTLAAALSSATLASNAGLTKANSANDVAFFRQQASSDPNLLIPDENMESTSEMVGGSENGKDLGKAKEKGILSNGPQACLACLATLPSVSSSLTCICARADAGSKGSNFFLGHSH